ncbi:MAG: competence/damage-inducible protein A [Deltaproteobacteria bacterium]|nr:MAG: competence/damage-inducible protein A [Deltaproteobacteria bacterium]
MSRVEIIAVGKEILRGKTLDTNSNWLARRISALGGEVARMVTVDDLVPEIVNELRTSRHNRSKVIITTGGMGPTFDDRTLEAVARATRRKLILNQEALNFVTQMYRDFKERGFVDSEELTPSRKKMALLPRGSTILPNSVGAAPGVKLSLKDTIIFCLPGVPAEMKAIFEESLVKEFQTTIGKRYLREKKVSADLGDESRLAGVVDQVMRQVPGVYIKSFPSHFGKEVHLPLGIIASGDKQKEVEDILQKAIEKLKEELKDIGHSLTELPEE